MYLIISGIVQLIILWFLVKSIVELKYRVVDLELKENTKSLENKFNANKSLQNEHLRRINRIDDLGRVVIPKELRRELCIDEGDGLEISLYKNGIFIKKPK